MNTLNAMRLFSDGRMSVHDARALLMSMGHSFEDCTNAFIALSSEAGSTVRTNNYQSNEYQAEIFLTAST